MADDKTYEVVICTCPTEFQPGDQILMTITRVSPSESGLRGYVHFSETEERIFLNEHSGPFQVKRPKADKPAPVCTCHAHTS